MQRFCAITVDMQATRKNSMKGKWGYFFSTQIFAIGAICLILAYLVGGLPIGSEMAYGLIAKPSPLTLALAMLFLGVAAYSGWKLKDPKPETGKLTAQAKPSRMPKFDRTAKVTEDNIDADAASFNRLQRLAAAAKAATEEDDQEGAAEIQCAADIGADQTAMHRPVPEHGTDAETNSEGGVAPSDDAIHPLIRRSTEQAILFRQHVPPRFDTKACSWFGGQPLAGPDFTWPMTQYAERANRPMTFMMQVDCAAIPAEARLGLLPDHGLIQLFMDLSQSTAKPGYDVRWVDAEPSKLVLARMPKGMPPAYGDQAADDHQWAAATDDPARFAYRLLLRWTFDPVMADAPSDHGTVMKAKSATLPHVEQSRAGEAAGAFHGFPHDWRAVQIASGHLLARLPSGFDIVAEKHFPDQTSEELNALKTLTLAEAKMWFDKASASAPFDAVDTDTAEEIWAWLCQRHWAIDDFANDILLESAVASLCHSPTAANRVPLRLLPFIEAKRALAVNSATTRMLSANETLQTEPSDLTQTHIMLFEFVDDEALGHRFGGGVFQFWITPDDLAARRFEKVVLTAGAY
jgi:Domain of unknown function (DUF1963)